MNEASQETHPLPYAGPTTRTPRAARLVVLAVVDALVAVGSLWFVPLAEHIYSCTESEKWCHIQAFVLGVPSAVVLVILFAVTASITIAPPAAGRSLKRLKIAAWLSLLTAAVVLLALFGAVVHNSE